MNDPRKHTHAERLRRPTAEEAEILQLQSRQALPVLRGYAEELAEGRGAPYDIGRKIWSTAMSSVSPVGIEGEQCHGLWLLWGALTDWVENKPDEKAVAEDTMRRAASEWLTVADDEPAWRAYFDRWLYDEMGYDRPAATKTPSRLSGASS